MSLQKFSNTCINPDETFKLGEEIGKTLKGGEILLLEGNLGAGKTLLTKGLVSTLDFDSAEVTSPSFALVNFYKAKFDVFHIDLWRLEKSSDPGFEIGLEEVLENEDAIVIIEWAEYLNFDFTKRTVIRIKLEGDGNSPRRISLTQ